MSKPKVFEKPAGLKDFLPEAAVQLRKVERQVLDCMERWGYKEIITPTLEFYDTVGISSSTEDRKLFKLLDRNGTMLVLRSDMTTPIARVVSSLLRDQPFPLRLSYHANVFRAIEAEAGRGAEFFQTGVELVGDPSAEADAEIVALAVAALQAAGVRKFKIALGHVGYLNGLFRERLSSHTEGQQTLKDCLLRRDYVGYRDTLHSLELEEGDLAGLEEIMRLRGGQEICDEAYRLTGDPLAQQSISHLCEVWKVLEAYGVSEHVVIDLTMIGDFEYYTGMTFEGYAADLGFPVCSGGRYDNLLSQFGRPSPATGFALKTNRILEVNGSGGVSATRRVLIAYDAEHRAEALKRAGELRRNAGDCEEGAGGMKVAVETKLMLKEETFDGAIESLKDGRFRYNGSVYDEVIQFGREIHNGRNAEGRDAERPNI